MEGISKMEEIFSDLGKLKQVLKKIDINETVPGTEGFKPLHVVAGIEAAKAKDSMMHLLENGADPNARSDENLTPCHIAASWDRVLQLETLLQHGGNPWLIDDENKNCFDMAADFNSYEAYQLLNLYLAQGKLNFNSDKRGSRKSKSANNVSFSIPKYPEHSRNENLNDSPNATFLTAKESKFNSPSVFSTPKNLQSSKADNLNDSKNVTFMSTNESKCYSPSLMSTPLYLNESKYYSPGVMSTPLYLEYAKSENLNDSKNCTFLSAKENFPLIFSSTEESDNCLSDASQFIRELNQVNPKENEKCQKIDFSFAAKEINSVSIKEEEEEKPEDKDCENNLNKAYIFSSTSDSSDTSTSDLNESDDSNYATIIDSSDNSGIVLIETKNENNMFSSNSSLCSIPNDWKSYHNVVSDCSTLSYCSSHSKSTLVVPEDLQQYSNSKIFDELKNMGDNPGPVLDHTRHVYLHRLARLISGCVISCELPKPKYCPEIYLFLQNKLDMDRAQYLEQNIAEEFDAETSREWREGNQRCCFNYFLLDPRVTQNLPQRASQVSKEQQFLTFLDALFYVGKGTKGRPYSHLFEAVKTLENERPKSEKVNHILDIWDANLGVISLHCFHNSIPVEAYTREACILEAVGLENLTNVRKGDYYGLCARLTSSRKRMIGISLLHRAFQIYLLEGERLIKPRDIRNK